MRKRVATVAYNFTMVWE